MIAQSILESHSSDVETLIDSIGGVISVDPLILVARHRICLGNNYVAKTKNKRICLGNNYIAKTNYKTAFWEFTVHMDYSVPEIQNTAVIDLDKNR